MLVCPAPPFSVGQEAETKERRSLEPPAAAAAIGETLQQLDGIMGLQTNLLQAVSKRAWYSFFYFSISMRRLYRFHCTRAVHATPLLCMVKA